jgi:two-component system, OmpR family, sensor histidine kinase BaeS
MLGRGIAGRIAAASIAAASLGLAILAVGIVVVGGQAFTAMMVDAGDTAQHAREMFDVTVTRVVLVAGAVAVAASLGLALLTSRRLGRPIDAIAGAARRVATGDYAARVRPTGPAELAALADSFNRMAADLEAQEHIRRDFIVNAAHELRTPLTNVQGYLEALRDGVIPADREAYDSLLEEAERLVRLSRSLDALVEGDPASGAPAALVPVDLGAALDAAVELFRPAFDQAGFALQVIRPGQVVVRANPDHLAQVLANLLSNALRYTLPRGRVDVGVDAGHRDVRVTVANTAAPIPADDLARLFERFYRVEKSRDVTRGGAGIGLAIVRQLVESAGGRVGATWTDGRARVWFTLPRPLDPLDRAARVNDAPAAVDVV